MSNTSTQTPNRSRPYLFGLFARIINDDNPMIAAESVFDGTRPTQTQIAKFEMMLRGLKVIAEDEHLVIFGCVDEVITPLVR